MWVLLAVLVVVVGFALRLNSMLVVAVAGVVAGLIGGISPVKIIETFGTGFANSRSVTVFLVVLPVIGMIERYGLMQQARVIITKLTKMTTGRLLAAYLGIRQITAAVGLMAVGGPAQAVRPIIAPMAEASAERKHGKLTERMREKIRSYAASADTVGLFFGEDVFMAVGSILLITGFVDTTYGLKLEALSIAVWAIPTAICAFIIHGLRMLRLDRTLAAMAAEGGGSAAGEDAVSTEEPSSAADSAGVATGDSKGEKR